VRLGDPETEVVLPRIESDLLTLFQSVASQNLHSASLQIDPRYAVCVILAAEGYPNHYNKGMRIDIDNDTIEEALIFHAGTQQQADGSVASAGGRVIAVTTLGDTLQQTIESTYQSVEHVRFDQRYYRTDIGQDLLPYDV
jgi:phosphoribosylamine--glycine ligase